MKKILMVIILFNSFPVGAEIFKCTSAEGAVYFQDNPCEKGLRQSAVEIKPVDQEKIIQAKEKQAQELKQWRAEQKEQAAAELKEREVLALEQDVRAKRELAEATLQQTQAIENNSDAMQNNYTGYWPYYYPRPIHRPYRHHQSKQDHQYPKKTHSQDKTAMERLKVMVK